MCVKHDEKEAQDHDHNGELLGEWHLSYFLSNIQFILLFSCVFELLSC